MRKATRVIHLWPFRPACQIPSFCVSQSILATAHFVTRVLLTCILSTLSRGVNAGPGSRHKICCVPTTRRTDERKPCQSDWGSDAKNFPGTRAGGREYARRRPGARRLTWYSSFLLKLFRLTLNGSSDLRYELTRSEQSSAGDLLLDSPRFDGFACRRPGC